MEMSVVVVAAMAAAAVRAATAVMAMVVASVAQTATERVEIVNRAAGMQVESKALSLFEGMRIEPEVQAAKIDAASPCYVVDGVPSCFLCGVGARAK